MSRLLDETVPVARRTMNMFFLIDTSGSMDGAKIGSLNSAMENIIPILKEISDNNADALIKVAVLEFSSGCQWMYPEPKELDDFSWQDLEADGMTSLGEACQELNAKLSRSRGYMNSGSGSFAPVVILMSDGIPTDDFETGLSLLRTNNWFKSAIKVSIAIGDDCDKQILAQFAGNSEAVITVHNTDALKKIIRIVSVTSSRVASSSASVGNGTTKQDDVIDQIKDQTKDIKGADMGTEITGDEDDWD